MTAASVLTDWRCAGCGRLLARVALLGGRLVIKCRCGTVNALDARTR